MKFSRLNLNQINEIIKHFNILKRNFKSEINNSSDLIEHIGKRNEELKTFSDDFYKNMKFRFFFCIDDYKHIKENK